MSSYEDVCKQLNGPIPASEVSQREGAGGKALDYLEHWSVVDTLNRVLGNGMWSTDLTRLDYTEFTDAKGKSKWRAIALVACHYTLPDGPRKSTYHDVGYGDGDIEKAIKEAVSDAEKRCHRHLGLRLGLALYEKKDADGNRTHVTPEQTAFDVVFHLLNSGDVAKVREGLEAARNLIRSGTLNEQQKTDVMELGKSMGAWLKQQEKAVAE